MIEEFSEIAKKKDRVRRRKYVEIMLRATVLGYMGEQDATDVMMDIESADKKFNLRLDEWLEADDFNFAHDFLGIRRNIVRERFPATNFGFFIPRFSSQN